MEAGRVTVNESPCDELTKGYESASSSCLGFNAINLAIYIVDHVIEIHMSLLNLRPDGKSSTTAESLVLLHIVSFHGSPRLSIAILFVGIHKLNM